MAPTTITLYDVGDVARVTAAFTDNAGAPADPTTVTAKVRDPTGVTTDYTVTAGQIVKDSVGNYRLDVACTVAGDWYYRFLGTGAVAAAEEGTFLVREQETAGALLSPTALTTVGAAREFVLSNAADGSQDRRLAKLINAYSTAVYNYTKREWLPLTASATRRFKYLGGGFLSLAPYDARTVTGVTMYTDQPTANQRVLIPGSSTVFGEYTLNPPGKGIVGTYEWLTLPRITTSWAQYSHTTEFYYPYTSQTEWEVSVTGDWGVGVIPDDVELAVLIAIKDAYENPTGYTSGTSGGLQFAEDTDAGATPEAWAKNLPVEARALLTDYRRTRVAVA